LQDMWLLSDLNITNIIDHSCSLCCEACAILNSLHFLLNFL